MFVEQNIFPWDASLYPDESKIITRYLKKGKK